MALLQPSRAGLARGRHAARAVASGLRALATDASPSSTSTSTSSVSTSPDPPSDPFPPKDTHVPRWSQTPPAMKAPLQMDFAKSPRNKLWSVNNSPARLDDMYNRLLGPGGSRMLPDELKWLAVTHKSFDQGRRGFNDRLALVGRMALVLEATKLIISKLPLDAARPADPRRAPFAHAQLAPVDNLAVESPKDVAGKDKLCALAAAVRLPEVVRWKPRLPDKLEASGVDVVLAGAVMAIIGAITLQHGSAVATKVVRERILARLPKDEA